MVRQCPRGLPGSCQASCLWRGGLCSCSALPVLLAGCNLVILNPSGYVALQQRNLIIASTVLML